MNHVLQHLLAKAIVLCIIFFVINIGHTQARSNILAGKKIEWIIPFKEGGGSDEWATFYAPFMTKHLPGNPSVQIKYVPGGGSIKGANKYMSQTRTDGLSILGTSASTQFAYLLGDIRVRYDYKKWEALMLSQTGGVVYVAPELGIKDISEIGKIREKRHVYGSQGATSVDLVPLLAFDFLGLDVHPIFGIRGRAIGRLAFERGEATIDFQTTAAYLKYVKPLVDEGRAIPLFSLGVLSSDGKLVRDPNFPNLPSFAEVYREVRGEEPEGIAWESWLAFFTAGFAAQDILVVSKTTDQTVVNDYRAAMVKIQQDKKFIERKAESIGNYKQVTGEPARRLYGVTIDVDERHKAWVRDWLNRKYNVKLKGSSR